ncbi:isochorismatase family protein [Lentilactobacillus buchneri]|uniref:Isochorismatase-like domain-containing protein n=1 Tax=Lentilactobacillus buchneri DSM 20057 TaxID=1423728 RepID=A0A4V3A3K5_LENBU|nr:isochorismatase family protein [Lentilactobacillus buchneri]AEB72478.1 isochorismatase hydrolase [Lentilactobacillus buchneri NRRL B-30929]KRK68271.1 isochorismatase hydrolase [Lentilactobacillus buchneri DSM 20057]MCT3252542.1 isochorismatase family protein [Lentilactobacillus buchneri]MCT3547135.1 isochorismatase family protein [Lentilactobacillus buchneri]MCT3554798.1 isochorismatase family protein [Lentilactobacillus buchneri]
MTSFDKRGADDRLLSPDNAVLTIIDYQPVQIGSIGSMRHADLLKNAEMVVEAAKLFKLPIVLSTVNAHNQRNSDTVKPLKDLIGDTPSYDRSSINAWEDKDYNDAIKATGRKKIIILALWTEACLTFPTIDAIAEGFDVYPVVDAVGGTSTIAHETALRRVEQAGAHLITIPQLVCELQRDWNRQDTVPGFVKLLQENGAFTNLQ